MHTFASVVAAAALACSVNAVSLSSQDLDSSQTQIDKNNGVAHAQNLVKALEGLAN